MYIIDWIGYPLCDWCQDWYLKGGRPYSPNARDRWLLTLAAYLAKSFPAELLPRLADFLVEDWEP